MKTLQIFFISTLFVFLGANIHASVPDDAKYPFHPEIEFLLESSNLPIVIIDLEEPMADKELDSRVSATMRIIWNTIGGRNSVEDTKFDNYNGRIGIKYRGNSSYAYSDKKPFAVRLENDKGKKLSASILGMGADSDWALLAPFNDKSMIRDMLLFELMRGTMEYVPTGKYCELILDGVYQGVYIMAARVRQGPHRVNIEAPSGDSGDGLTGGYHLEIDVIDSPGFLGEVPPKDLKENDIDTKTFYQYKYPDMEDMSQAQLNYIKTLVKNMESAFAGDDFKHPETGYRAYVDTLSMMDFIIAQELSKNVDAYRKSTPFYKDVDSKDPRFKFSIWDFNISMGNTNFYGFWSPEGWAFNANQYIWRDTDTRVPWMFKRILQDTVFYGHLKARWSEYRKDRLNNQHILAVADSLINVLQEAQERNFTVWNRFNKEIWPNYYIAASWEDELNYLKNWLTHRASWIDSQWMADHVNYVANGNLEADWLRGTGDYAYPLLSMWLCSDDVSDDHSLNWQCADQRYQILTEIPQGKYTMRFSAVTQGNSGGIAYLKNYNKQVPEEEMIYQIGEDMPLHPVEIKDIEVTNHFVELGFKLSFETGDGSFPISNIEFVKQNEGAGIFSPRMNADNGISIYVDRSRKELKIKLKEPMLNSTLEVFDIAGRRLYQQKIPSQEATVDGIFIQNSVYIVKVGTYAQKIVF